MHAKVQPTRLPTLEGCTNSVYLVPIMVDGDPVRMFFAENCDDSTPVAHGLVSGRFSTSKSPTGTEMLSSVIVWIRGTDWNVDIAGSCRCRSS